MLSERLSAIYGDPILDRMLSLARLPVAEQLNWIEWASSKLVARKRELETSLCGVREPHIDLILEGECALIDLRLECLQRLWKHILAEQRSDAGAD